MRILHKPEAIIILLTEHELDTEQGYLANFLEEHLFIRVEMYIQQHHGAYVLYRVFVAAPEDDMRDEHDWCDEYDWCEEGF